MKKIIFLLIPILLHYTCKAQWQWAKHIYSNDQDVIASNCQDNSGNLFVLGGFTGNLFYGYTDTLSLNGYNDIFLAKYDANGNELWIKQFGGNVSSFCPEGGSIHYDAINNFIYMYVYFCGSATFGTDTFQAFERDIGLIKLDVNGNVVWSKHIGGLGIDVGVGISTDNSGSIYLSGINTQQAYFDTLTQVAGGFFAKYDNMGNRILVKKICDLNNSGSSAQFQPSQLIFDNNHIDLIGTTTDDTLMLDTINVAIPNQVGGLYNKFDLNGNIQNLEKIGFPSSTVFNFANDINGNFYITGKFYSDSAIFGATVLTNNSQPDGFLIKYDTNRTMKWVIQLQATGGGEIRDVMVLLDNGVYVTGSFTGSAKFGTNTINAQGGTDMFLARYDSSGNCLGATTLPNSDGRTLALDANNNVIVTGRFLGNLQIGSSNFTNMGNYDIFIAKHDAITGFEEGEWRFANKELIIYANPNQGKCNITVPDDFVNEQNLVLSIYDNTGKLIQQKTLEMNEGKIKVNLEQEAKGVYNVTLANKKKSYSGKIVFE